MKNTKTPIGIEQIQKIKMTLEEKERILGNVLSSPIQITKPIKSPYSFVSMFQRNQFAYFGVILLLLVVLGGGNMALNYFQRENTEIARINTGGINTFPTNTNNFNNTMPTTNGTPKNKNTTSSPSLPSSPFAQNTNNGGISSSGPTAGILAPAVVSSESSNNVRVSLGNEFTLAQNQLAIIDNTGLQIKITEFSNSPCVGECVWSGIGIGFEYSLDGKTENGMNLTQTFGYQVKIIGTDYKTYANLTVTKIE